MSHKINHGHRSVDMSKVPRSRSYKGRFGRMFSKLEPLTGWTRELLSTLSRSMLDNEFDPENDNHQIPAGYTYLGQFITHDITFDPKSVIGHKIDPDGLQNFRTPRFDLDSMYGGGPVDSPFMYEKDGKRFRIEKLSVLSKTDDAHEPMPLAESLGVATRDKANSDLPRRINNGKRDVALVGDSRNDENKILSQLLLAFMKFHNEVVDSLKRSRFPEHKIFEEAQKLTRWHYQWIVINDYLPKIVGSRLVKELLKSEKYVVGYRFSKKKKKRKKILGQIWETDLKFYDWRNDPFIPLEFAGAANRFGHSMVRFAYRIHNNDPINHKPDIQIFDGGNEADAIGRRLDVNPINMVGKSERPQNWDIGWGRFFDFNSYSGIHFNETELDKFPQKSRKIDTKITTALSLLRPAVDTDRTMGFLSLAAINLHRGSLFQLPSGQRVAKAMGVPQKEILNAQTILPQSVITAEDYTDGLETPLWYYILKEAEIKCDGQMLGPVGGRIVAEVLIGILLGDPNSYMNQDPCWRPTLTKLKAKKKIKKKKRPKYGMTDFLSFADVFIQDPPPPQNDF